MQRTAFGLSCCNLLCAQRFYLVFRYINKKVFCSPELPNQEFLSPCCPFDTSITCVFPRPRVVGEHISCYFVRSPTRFFVHISRRPQRSGSASRKCTAGVKQWSGSRPELENCFRIRSCFYHFKGSSIEKTRVIYYLHYNLREFSPHIRIKDVKKKKHTVREEGSQA